MGKALSKNTPKPDYDSMIKVIHGLSEADRVYHIEVLVDEEIKKIILQDYLEEAYYPPVGSYYAGVSGQYDDPGDYKKGKDNYYISNIKFHYGVGYDIVTDHDFLIGFEGFNNVSMKCEDTALISRGERFWAQEGVGVIKNWDDFEKFPWGKIDYLLEDYDKHLNFIGKNLPDGIGVACVGAVNAPILGWMFGFTGLFYLIYDNFGLVSKVYENVGNMIYKMYSIAASKEFVRVLWHGDDLGFNTSTILSKEHMDILLFEWFKKYSDLAHKNKKDFWVHCCGYKDSIMENFISDIKADALHSFQDNCCPVIEYKKRHGKDIAILGGIDMNKLATFDEKSLKELINKTLDSCIPGGRYALGSGNSITNFIPVRNYLTLLEEGYKYKC